MPKVQEKRTPYWVFEQKPDGNHTVAWIVNHADDAMEALQQYIDGRTAAGQRDTIKSEVWVIKIEDINMYMLQHTFEVTERTDD